MLLQLRAIKGRERGRTLQLEDGAIAVMGRAPDVEFSFDDRMMSRRHARFEARDGVVIVTDLNSSNGTWVNGERVRERRLAHGDRLRIGGHVFHVELPHEASAGPGPRRPRQVAFCARCYAAVPLAEASADPTGAGALCPGCAGGDAFSPDIIEGFKLGQRLGADSLGPVFLAYHLTLHKKVAIKIITAERAVDEVALRRFIREAKIGGRLFHPHIVEMYDAAQAGGHYYISMEYVGGESLRQRLERQGPLPAGEAVRIGAALAAALAYAHERGVIHRNVRPGSVLLGEAGQVKLGDFGLARLLSPDEPRLTPPGEPLGTLCYMAPEQLEDAGAADARSDVFGLGATLYHALAGSPPFLAPSIPEILANVRSGALVPLRQARPDLPAELVTAIAHCLAHEPAHRYQSAAELAQALRRLLPPANAS
ncbi:MAG: hypothetical protein KatS3mg102_1977 [Planctomycetota bacterium]|nr:MAG: hypothetical protein KatS3mg102_1977 [Planctomycetota bacterium]